jgi:hypothetical protein
MEYSTVWKSISTAPPIPKTSRTAKSFDRSSHNNSKGSETSHHLNKEARNAMSNHPYPSQPKHRIPTSQSRAMMSNTIQRLGFCQISTKLGCRKENAYTADHRNIKHTGARNIHAPTSLTTLLPQKMEQKSNTNAPSIVYNQKTGQHCSVPSLAREEGRTGTEIAVIGYEGVDGNNMGNSTASDFTKA